MKRLFIIFTILLASTQCSAGVVVAKDKISFDKWNDGTMLDFKVPETLKAADFAVAVKDGKQEFSKGDLNEALTVRSLAPSNEIENGGVEYEYVWKKKPLANSFSIAIDLTGLTAYYQPALTQKEIDEGLIRPENVVGSYAFYHATKKDHQFGGINYMAGKHSHLYRPKAVDADGKEIWCEFNKDLDATGVLTTTCPQSFLDTAQYPVKI